MFFSGALNLGAVSSFYLLPPTKTLNLYETQIEGIDHTIIDTATNEASKL